MNIELIGNFVGLTLAHTAFIGSGQDGELMVPYIILQSGAKREVQNFEAETQQKAIELAHKAIDKQQASVDAWAYAQEGVIELADGTKQDVYLIKAWSNDLAEPIELYQRTQSVPFKLIGSIQMLNFEKAGFTMDQAETFMNALNTGILSHKSANENWKNWFE
ncbi:hypothetical protein HQQ94_10025 [Shewanella sp. VB17]|uniref:hypothetical protein n=1 Tax=Shewanella sp. VB17 TaxID=2739432 RepID=UPI001565FC71|nr:hypothetical protein [Shewanella sp. VB17]NRD73579.1 hypothetical protein [Shewanella sp. VB17]